MKVQEKREGDALVIFTAVLITAVPTAIAGVLLVLVAQMAGVGKGLINVAFWVCFACAAATALVYLYRHRRA